MNNQISTGSVLAWGIVALCLCCDPIIGLIFALIGNSKAKAFKNVNGYFYGPAKVGSIFCKIAVPVSIAMQVFWVLYIVILVAAMS